MRTYSLGIARELSSLVDGRRTGLPLRARQLLQEEYENG